VNYQILAGSNGEINAKMGCEEMVVGILKMFYRSMGVV